VVLFFEKGAPTRSPQDIIDEIAVRDADSVEVLATIRGAL